MYTVKQTGKLINSVVRYWACLNKAMPLTNITSRQNKSGATSYKYTCTLKYTITK